MSPQKEAPTKSVSSRLELILSNRVVFPFLDPQKLLCISSIFFFIIYYRGYYNSPVELRKAFWIPRENNRLKKFFTERFNLWKGRCQFFLDLAVLCNLLSSITVGMIRMSAIKKTIMLMIKRTCARVGISIFNTECLIISL